MYGGMIHGSLSGGACPGCKQTTKTQDLTCPSCGAILDQYLFSTVTPESVSGEDKDAFTAGYEACMGQWNETGSLDLGVYRPVPGHETAYRAGWRHASGKIEARAERQRGRRRGLALLGSGVCLPRLAWRSCTLARAPRT
jgi:hypothetical protein